MKLPPSMCCWLLRSYARRSNEVCERLLLCSLRTEAARAVAGTEAWLGLEELSGSRGLPWQCPADRCCRGRRRCQTTGTLLCLRQKARSHLGNWWKVIPISMCLPIVRLLLTVELALKHLANNLQTMSTLISLLPVPISHWQHRAGLRAPHRAMRVSAATFCLNESHLNLVLLFPLLLVLSQTSAVTG